MRTDFNPYFTRCAVSTLVATTNDGTHHWQVLFRGVSLDFVSTTTIFSIDTSGDTADVYTDHEGNASDNTPTQDIYVDIALVKVDTPGNLTVAGSIYHRFIVT